MAAPLTIHLKGPAGKGTSLAPLFQKFQNTKLKGTRGTYARVAGGDEELRQMTMDSLRATISELQEEIARYEARRRVAEEAART